jgi:hypothetical protein
VINKLHGTSPLIYHAQGRPKFCPLWPTIEQKCNTLKEIPNEFDVITFNNGNSYNSKLAGTFEKSIQHKCHVLGRDIVKWKNVLKIELLIKFLENSEKELVLVADSSDVAIYSFDGMIERFSSKDCDLLFNAEVNCWPVPDQQAIEKSRFLQPFCHLNAGAFIGKRIEALNFYRYCSSLVDDSTSSEQYFIKKAYVDWYPSILIDDSCLLFQTLNGVNRNHFDVD